MPRLDVAFVKVVSRFGSHQSYKFPTCFSSVMFLNMALTKVTIIGAFHSFCSYVISFGVVLLIVLCSVSFESQVALCSGINYSRLIELKLSPDYSDYYWLESLVHLLHNSPKLTVVMNYDQLCKYLPHTSVNFDGLK